MTKDILCKMRSSSASCILTSMAKGFSCNVASCCVACPTVSALIDDEAELFPKLSFDITLAVGNHLFFFRAQWSSRLLHILAIPDVEEGFDCSDAKVQDAGPEFQTSLSRLKVTIWQGYLAIGLVADWTGGGCWTFCELLQHLAVDHCHEGPEGD